MTEEGFRQWYRYRVLVSSRTGSFWGVSKTSEPRRPFINLVVNVLTVSPSWHRFTSLLMLACAMLPMLGSEQAYAEESAESALPQLPAKIRDQLEADRLRREIALEKLRRELEDLRGSGDVEVQRKIERLGELQELLEVDRDVRGLLEESPELELAREYDRIVATSEPSQSACACLENARVHWLGQGDQAGQVIVYLDGLYHDVGAGEGIGSSRCRVQEAMADGIILQCGAQRSARNLHNPVGGR